MNVMPEVTLSLTDERATMSELESMIQRDQSVESTTLTRKA
jgi:hypothetical protein